MFLNHFGHRRTTIQVEIEYAIQGYIQDLKIYMVGNSLSFNMIRLQAVFTDHNASGRGLILLN